jgi:hypothetical protein
MARESRSERSREEPHADDVHARADHPAVRRRPDPEEQPLAPGGAGQAAKPLEINLGTD